MRRFFFWTVLMIGVLAANRARAGQDDDPAPKPSWFNRMLPFKKPAPAKTPAKDEKASKARIVADSAAVLKVKEKADWLRRVAVCDKLREIALQTNDDELRRKADQLDQRAWDLYLKHSAQIPADTTLQADERILERRLGTSAASAQGLLPNTRRGNAGGQAAIREE